MDNQSPELWDLYDKNNNRVGVHPKGVKIPAGMYHIAVEIIATDRKGHILVTQRALTKKKAPGMWEFPAGSVMAGETPAAAAARELFEETGLRAEALQGIQQATVPGLKRIIFGAYIPNLLQEKIVLQESETMNYSIITADQWYSLLSRSLFDRSRINMYSAPVYKFIDEKIGTPPDVALPDLEQQTVRTVKKKIVVLGQEKEK